MLRIVLRRWELPNACPAAIAAVLKPVLTIVENALDSGGWTLRRATIGLPGSDERYLPLGALMEDDCRMALRAADTMLREALDEMEAKWPSLVSQVEATDPGSLPEMPDSRIVRDAFSVSVSLDEQCAIPVRQVLVGGGTEVPF
jgi:hypothetical protein